VQKYTDFLNSNFGKTGNIFAEAKKALSKKEIETALKSDEAKAKPKDKVTLKKAPWEEETQNHVNEESIEEQLTHNMDAGELRQYLVKNYGHIEHGSYVTPKKMETYNYHVGRLAKMAGISKEEVKKNVKKDYAHMDEETQINEDDYAKEMYKKGASAAVMQSVPPGPRAHPEYVRGYKEKTAELNKKYGIKENNIFSDNELAHIMSISESDYSSVENDYNNEKNSEYKDKLKRMYGAKREYEQSAGLYRHEYHQGREHFEKGSGDFDFHGNPYHHADPKYHAWRQGHLDAAGPEDDEDK